MVKLWGRASSANVQKVLWCAEEVGVALERVDLGGRFGGNDTAAYRALNPNGLVPTLQDDDAVIWESNTIVRYLAATYAPGTLWPLEPAARARAECWMDWQLSTPYADLTALFRALIRSQPAERDAAAMAGQHARLCGYWALVDVHLAGQPYLGGATLTMGDIPLGALTHRWFNLPIERPVLPHLEAWYQRLRRRPGYARHVAVPLS